MMKLFNPLHLDVEETDEADNELRKVICQLWPNHAKKLIKLDDKGGTKSLLDLVVPPKTGKKKIHQVF